MSRHPQQREKDTTATFCELATLDDLGRLYAVKEALETHGIEAFVEGDPASGVFHLRSTRSRILVRRRDLVYARWVAHAAGVDVWPDAASDDSDLGHPQAA